MKTTVADLIETLNFNDFEIIAGYTGIDRKVKSVTVMDAPDIYKWIKGGEFLITSGYCMKDDPMKMEFLIKKLDEAGASGLGIKLNRFIDELPQNVLTTAEKLSFPLIYIPIKYAFVDIINPVLSEIVNKQARRLEHSEKIHRSFTQLVINGGNTQQIIDTLSNILDKDVVFYDQYFYKTYKNIKNEMFLEDINSSALNEIILKYSYYTIQIDNRVYGYLVVNESFSREGFEEFDGIALEHASTVLKLNMQKKISNYQIETRYRDEFVQDLIMNNVKSLEEVKNRAEIYGWNFDKGVRGVIVDIDDYKAQYLKIRHKRYNDTLESIRQKIFKIVINIMKESSDQIVYTTFSDSIVFLVDPIDKSKKKAAERLKKIGDQIRKSISKINNFTVTIGIGNFKSNIMNINDSYQEAQKAIKLGRMIYKGDTVIFYDQLGVYSLFSKVCETDEGRSFHISKLKKLIYHDKKFNTNLLSTLECIIENDWNLSAASKEMYIHYNTIKYRFQKIGEILESDFQDVEHKLEIMIAMKLYKMTK
jgi:purine catabolism regulator